MTTAALVLWLATIVVGPIGVGLWTWRLGRLAALRPPPPRPLTASVSIIVPARDEAHNLPRLLASLAALDPAPREIIVVDDHSTDGTGDLARAAGATVIVPPPLPPGWLGKAWACQAGADVATGELLLFTDADTAHGPTSLGQAAALLADTDAGLLSVVPSHRAVAGWEALQGPFQLLLLAACRAGADVARGARRFAIGQYLLFPRAAYDRIGGHHEVRGRIAEDLHLAARIADGGGRVALLRAPDALTVRMYPEGMAAFARGWRRSFRAGLETTGAGGGLEVVAMIGWLLGVPLSLVAALVTGHALAIAGFAAAYVATAAELARRQRLVGRLPWAGALAFPVAILAFVAISAAAGLDRLRSAPVRWRGRSVSLERP